MKNVKLFKDYVKMLKEYLKDHPEAGLYPTVSAKDEEGNGFDFVLFSPTIMKMENNPFGHNNAYDLTEEEIPDDTINVVCIN